MTMGQQRRILNGIDIYMVISSMFGVKTNSDDTIRFRFRLSDLLSTTPGARTTPDTDVSPSFSRHSKVRAHEHQKADNAFDSPLVELVNSGCIMLVDMFLSSLHERIQKRIKESAMEFAKSPAAIDNIGGDFAEYNNTSFFTAD